MHLGMLRMVTLQCQLLRGCSLNVRHTFLTAPRYHFTRYDEMEEDPRIPFLLGENPMDHANLRENELPCRLLSSFTIFDSDAENVLVSLANLNSHGSTHFGAAGVAAAYLEDEEDAGQEDRDDSDVVSLHLRNITCTFDYTEVDGLVRVYGLSTPLTHAY